MRWLVSICPTEEFRQRYPHQLSGGQQQRVFIAVALGCGPPVIVLDEPTTGLDVVTQPRVLVELSGCGSEQRVSMVYVRHDLAVVAQIADRIAVMYAGRVVEEGRGGDPAPAAASVHRGLVASIPDHLDPRRLEPMPGVAVGVGERPTGCAFAPRCPLRWRSAGRGSAAGERRGRPPTRCIRPAEVTDAIRAPTEFVRTSRDQRQPICAFPACGSSTTVATKKWSPADDVNLILDCGRLRRARRGVGQRQDDDRSRDRRTATDRRRGDALGGRRSRTRRESAVGRAAPAYSDHVPEPG